MYACLRSARAYWLQRRLGALDAEQKEQEEQEEQEEQGQEEQEEEQEEAVDSGLGQEASARSSHSSIFFSQHAQVVRRNAAHARAQARAHARVFLRT